MTKIIDAKRSKTSWITIIARGRERDALMPADYQSEHVFKAVVASETLSARHLLQKAGVLVLKAGLQGNAAPTEKYRGQLLETAHGCQLKAAELLSRLDDWMVQEAGCDVSEYLGRTITSDQTAEKCELIRSLAGRKKL